MLNALLTEWELWMRAASQSERTIDGRLRIVALLAARTGCDPATCDWRDVAKFLGNPRLARSSRSTYRAGLRAWFSWLVLTGHRRDNPVDLLPRTRTPRGIPHPVTTDELGQALSSGRFYHRTRTMILLGAYQGLRAHEVARFRGEQLRGCRIRLIGKGDVEAEIPAHPLLIAEAARYPRIGYWFPSPKDRSQPITAKNVSRVVSEALRRAGVDHSCHALRHWYGTESLRAAGGNLRVAQELLRHASPATTAIYTKVDDAEKCAAVRALPVPLHAV